MKQLPQKEEAINIEHPAVMRNTFDIKPMLDQSLDYLSSEAMGNYDLFPVYPQRSKETTHGSIFSQE